MINLKYLADSVFIVTGFSCLISIILTVLFLWDLRKQKETSLKIACVLGIVGMSVWLFIVLDRFL